MMSAYLANPYKESQCLAKNHSWCAHADEYFHAHLRADSIYDFHSHPNGKIPHEHSQDELTGQ